MTILHLDSSALGEASVTRQLTQATVDALLKSNPGTEINYRDVGTAPPDHLANDLVKVVKLNARDNLTPHQKQGLAETNALVDEFLAADTIVIGAPMYNFSVPTQLKAWFDRIAQAGRTFKYTETGPVGLAGDKRVIVLSARGGVYSSSEGGRALDFQEDYVKAVLGFLGVTNITVIRAEGVALGEEARTKAIAGALAEIALLAG